MTLVQEVYKKLSNTRSLYRLISSEKFDVIFSYANENDKAIIKQAIDNNDSDSLSKWLKNKSREIDYNEVNIKELHTIAKQHGITNYSRLPKFILVSEINKLKSKT